MATQFAGCNLGQPIESVTFGTSTTSKTVEITYNDAVIKTTSELRDTISKIIDAMDQARLPAA
jgi:hypothetical protein